ncbi:Hypothetical predicted protein [Mytilus galloprovincialis]|uniref:Ig-like domain-containing protein n=1 Tax=Mytilus galloprovincialis TaxID=29158 RepID=A0A8B6GSX4_MYTGA|nr:Hypothetical predicted protein [Mytilus galloprovincialis]
MERSEAIYDSPSFTVKIEVEFGQDYVQGIIIYVNENSTNVLRCPLKADIGLRINWNGPPSFMAYTIGTDINPKLPHSDRISVVGKIEEGEYNLQISNIQQSDIGQYRCFGNVDGNIETAFLELNVAVPPVTGPSISRNPSGPLFVGNTIVLKCEVIGGTPLAKISWQCDGFFGEHNTSTDNNIESTVNLNLRQSDNNKKCKCVANHPSWTSQKSVDIVLNVFFAPGTNLTIQRKPAGGIISGNKVNLTCTASGGNPLATLLWNCSGTNTNYTTENTVSYSVEFEVDKSDNNKVCTCSATHPITSYTPQTHSSLIVYYVPETNPIIEQKPHGGIPVGGIVSLTCTVPGGNPLATLFWNCTGISKNETVVGTASYSIEFTVDKSFNKKICVCTTDHKINTYKPTVQHQLIVYYAPSDLPSIQQTPSGGIITGSTVMLTCSIKGGNPPAILIWNCTGDTTNSTTNTTAIYSVSFKVIKTQNKAICACSASHPVTSYTPVIYHSLEVYCKYYTFY